MNKTTRNVSFFLACTMFFASCSSSTMIVSNPPDAKLYLDGEFVGKTPYKHRDSKIVGSSTLVKIEKEGYAPLVTEFSKNEEADIGAIIGGIFVWVPFLWTLKYKQTHNYELNPIAVQDAVKTEMQQTQQIQQVPTVQKSKADKLRELKKLLDEKIITQNEFEKEKAKVLEETNN
ncbi:MAG TPA: PEGA domain-containing protein [Paludibacter sp.]|nr:PEGA domain-containing protein [Paludibacter sp.]